VQEYVRVERQLPPWRNERARLKSKARPGTTFFDDIKSEDQAYWLGFMAADGYITQSGRMWLAGIQLKNDHLEHLRLLGRFFDREPYLKSTRRPNGRVDNMASLGINSRYLVEQLNNIGVVFNKTLSPELARTFNHVPDHLLHHFVRGCFDGDGSAVLTAKRRVRVEFSGNRFFLARLRPLLWERLGLLRTEVTTNKACHADFAKVRWCHMLDVFKLTRWMYKDATVFLPEKRERLERQAALPPGGGEGGASSYFRGIGWRDQRGGCWLVTGHEQGRASRPVRLGYFTDELEAAAAWDVWARGFHGDGAPQNMTGLDVTGLPPLRIG